MKDANAVLQPTPGNNDPWWNGPISGAYKVGDRVLVLDDEEKDWEGPITKIEGDVITVENEQGTIRVHHSWVIATFE